MSYGSVYENKRADRMTVKGGLYYAKDYLRVIRRCRRIPIGIRPTGIGLGDYMVLTVGTRRKDTMGT